MNASDDRGADACAADLPASASRDYGKPFAHIFKDTQFDFYKIDPMLFAPAEVLVCNLGRQGVSRRRMRFGAVARVVRGMTRGRGTLR